jgi:hypothetical protein
MADGTWQMCIASLGSMVEPLFKIKFTVMKAA